VNSASYGCIHKAVMDDLQPSSRYYYRVGSEANGWSDIHSFTTAPPAGSSESFKVAVFGDTQDNEFNTEFEKTESIIESLTEHNTDFSIHYGDIVVNGSYTNSWLNFIKTAEPLISRSPMMTTLGNHDIINADNEYFQTPYPIFYDLFTMPGNGLDYAFTYGNAHFVCIYSGHAGRAEPKGVIRYSPGSPEREWLENELSQARNNPEIDWIITFKHYPVYSFGSSNIAGWKENIAPIFDEYGVDLSLAGHRHAYERHHPIYNGVRAEDNKGTVYITNGTSGGSPQGTGGSSLPTMAFTISERMYNYAVMTISGKKLEYHVYDINDRLIDNFVIEK
jgi:acid phosphatase type 7